MKAILLVMSLLMVPRHASAAGEDRAREWAKKMGVPKVNAVDCSWNGSKCTLTYTDSDGTFKVIVLSCSWFTGCHPAKRWR